MMLVATAPINAMLLLILKPLGHLKVCGMMQKANVSSVKYQVCRLIRMLVHICKTLDSMPAEVGQTYVQD